MSDKPQVGDKVRVSRTYEDGVELTWTGIVDSVSSLGLSFRNYAFMSKNYSFEILERAKPKFEIGDVYYSPSSKCTYMYMGGDMWADPYCGELAPQKRLLGDPISANLKLVLRKGKPVEEAL